MLIGRKLRLAWVAVPVVVVPMAVLAAGDAAPIARYDMRAGTVSGFGSAGGGMGAAMSMMMGGGGSQVQHELYLRLGSAQAPAGGKARADHFMPPAAKLGKSVALTIPPRAEETPDLLPEKPKGRLLIFWGCGEHAPKGQPVIIDFAKVAAGQVPPGMPGSAVIRDWGPTAENSRTFARWPAEDHKYVKADSSLVGPHKVVSSYTPEIAFTLARDFMAPITSTTAKLPSGASRLTWTGVPGATAWLAFVTGGKQGPGGEMGDMVMWTSSSDRQFGGGLADWVSPEQAASLVKSGTLMGPATTSCAVPAEVIAASPDFRVGTLTAFGPQESFAYPPRPADTKVAWKPDWTARIRHRSTTSWMQAQGMEMGAAGMTGEGNEGEEGEKKPPCKPKKSGLGGMLGGIGAIGGIVGGGNKGC
ncbi:hypothetical protein [Novosphingobium sp. AP12]|uniref:hypothetical protein n=1 Tax=Novosphingobium sp. AP12 TaxID=1144305 RepID=UPI0002720AF2|nr:hypothetical protein [Novosphingobium sp. AP12]EJL25545.1 hypothetical protein PMI02_03205 [Novosphingobium sp. AP12]